MRLDVTGLLYPTSSVVCSHITGCSLQLTATACSHVRPAVPSLLPRHVLSDRLSPVYCHGMFSCQTGCPQFTTVYSHSKYIRNATGWLSTAYYSMFSFQVCSKCHRLVIHSLLRYVLISRYVLNVSGWSSTVYYGMSWVHWLAVPDLL